MLFTSLHRARAVHVPLFLLVVALGIAGGSSFGLFKVWEEKGEVAFGPIAGVLAGLGILALALEELRLLKIVAGRLVITNIYRTKSLQLSQAALGTRVSHSSRSGPTYIVYALAERQRFDLASASSKKGEARLKERLRAALLSGRLDSSGARAAQDEVDEKEMTWKKNQAEAQAYVSAYYASGKAKKQVMWMVGGVVLYMLLMLAWFSWFEG